MEIIRTKMKVHLHFLKTYQYFIYTKVLLSHCQIGQLHSEYLNVLNKFLVLQFSVHTQRLFLYVV